MSKFIYYCSNKMSCIPPTSYKDRFVDYLVNKFVADDIKKSDNE